MPFVISKTVANVVASTMIGASGEYGIIEQMIPITREVIEPVVETHCNPHTVRKNSWWRGNYYEQELYCNNILVHKRQSVLVGHYIVYNNNGKRTKVRQPL